MGKIERFEDIEIWKLARNLAKDIYKITNESNFCCDIRFKSQIRASAGSIMG